MGDSGLFALLRGGIKFDRSKHGREMDLVGRQQAKAQRAAEQTGAAASEAMPRELDFFGEHARREEAAARARKAPAPRQVSSSSSSSSSDSESGAEADDTDDTDRSDSERETWERSRAAGASGSAGVAAG